MEIPFRESETSAGKEGLGSRYEFEVGQGRPAVQRSGQSKQRGQLSSNWISSIHGHKAQWDYLKNECRHKHGRDPRAKKGQSTFSDVIRG